MIFLFLVEAFKIFAQDRVHPLLRMFQLAIKEGLDVPGEGFFFALFPKLKKVRSWDRTRVRGSPPVSAHPGWRLSSRMHPCRNPTSGCSSLMAARPITGTDAPMGLSGSRLLASTWFGSGRWTRRRRSPTTGTGTRVSVGMAFLLFVLGDGQRGEGLGIPSILPGCHHVPATMSRSSSSPSCSCSGGAPDSVHDQSAGHSSCVQSWLRGGGVLLSRFAWFDSGYMSCVCSGVLWDFFLCVCGARLLKSILSCSPVWGVALVVDLGYGMCLLVSGYGAPRPVFPSILLA